MSAGTKILQLRRDRQAIIQKAKHMLALADEEQRGLSTEEDGLYEDFMGEVENLGNEIERRERLVALGGENGAENRQRFAPEPDAGAIGMSQQETRRYSLVRAIRAQGSGDWRGAELELEASNEVGKRLGLTAKGFFVPFDVMSEKRDLSVGVPAAGGYVVQDTIMSQSFIELLRNRLVVQQAGATVMTGLVGDISIPKQTGGATAYWVGEGADITESQQTMGQVRLSPRTLGAYTDYSRRLMLQASIDVESFVRNDLAATLQIAIDRAALHGAGAANEPLGVANTVGIAAPGTGAATLAMVIALETAVAVENADVGRLAYITNATARGALKGADVGIDTGRRVWDTMAGGTPVNGYPAFVTNQVTGNNVFFGNWSDLMIGFWSGLDIMVNPYTLSTSGTMRVVALQDVDVAVRHPQSFAIDATA